MPNYKIGSGNYDVDQFPALCPRCNRLISPVPRNIDAEPSDITAELIFECPNCRRFMIAEYELRQHLHPPFRLVRTLPATPRRDTFPLLRKMSSGFEELYNQSLAADLLGLSEIAGTGYRKALEFLVKDYCVALHPGNASDIRKKFLKNVIDDYVPDGKLKMAATFTAWLGNDEGHYERRWADADLEDLKALLGLTITFVSEEVQLEEYIRRMRPTEPMRLTFIQQD